MKTKLLIFLLCLNLNGFGNLPITGLCLQDVLNYFNCPECVYINCLDDCFTRANPAYFDPAYAVAGGNYLDDFRNYGAPTCNQLASLTTTVMSEGTYPYMLAEINVSSAGSGCTVTEMGMAYSTSSNPTISGTHSVAPSVYVGGSYSWEFNGSLTPGATYYYRAYATNSYGTAYGNEDYMTMSSTCSNVGDACMGGIIAYIFTSGDPGYVAGQFHGLVVTSSDVSNSQWGCSGTSISGADGTALGTGNQNTSDIVSGCATVGIAAKQCSYLDFNGYSDWYLPSKDELNKVYINKAAIGVFTSGYYWSSSEYSTTQSWNQDFTNGSQGQYTKSFNNYVRAIRSF